MLEYGYMAPAMFAGLIVFLLFGFPVAFSLSALGLFFGLLAIEVGYFGPEFLQALPYRMFGIMSNDLLLAIPFFTFMGAMLERSGLAEDLLDGFGQLFGPLPGGLAYAVIFVGAILGAITGTVAASVIAMGMITLPVMLRYGYDMRHRHRGDRRLGHDHPGHPAVAGADRARRPARRLGRRHVPRRDRPLDPAGRRSSLLFILAVSILQPHKVPALPPEARTLHGWALISKVLWGMVPSLVLIFLVLGTIFMGLATPTEAGAMGAVGAIVLAMLHGRYRNEMMWQAMTSTTRITAMVIFILIGATVFSLVFQGVNGGRWIEHILSDLPGGEIGFLIFTNVFVFFIAFFLDFFEIVFIVVPMLVPVARGARHRPDLVRPAALREHADLVHAPAVRLRAVLPARHRAAGGEDQRTSTGARCPGSRCSSCWSAILIFWPESVTYWIGEHADARPGRGRAGARGPDAARDRRRPRRADFGARPPALNLEWSRDKRHQQGGHDHEETQLPEAAAGGGAAAARSPRRRSRRASRSCSGA